VTDFEGKKEKEMGCNWN